MRLTAKVFTTLDGVYQGPGGPDEDRRGGFDRGGWQAHHNDDVFGDFVRAAYDGADAMLLGRVTWEIWESYWPRHDDHPVGHIINTIPRYVPTTTRTETDWAGTHFLTGDVEASIREVKAQPGRDLLLQGSGALLRWLLERDLVDELTLIVYPIVVGEGLRLFGQGGPGYTMELLEAQATPAGIVIQTFRPAGPLRRGRMAE
jgi:dihydrofolate reductase